MADTDTDDDKNVPPTNAEIRSLFVEMNKTHEAMKGIVETRSKEGENAINADEWRKVNESLDEVKGQYEEVRKMLSRPGGEDAAAGGETRDAEKAALERRAFEKFVRHGNGENGLSRMDEHERRALNSMVDTEGGFFIPVDFETEVIKQAFNEAELRPVVNVNTTGRDRVRMPSISKPIVAWGRSGLAVPEQQLKTGREDIEIFDLRALILLDNNALEDEGYDLYMELMDQFPGAIGEAEDLAFSVAAGDDSPQGFLADKRVSSAAVTEGAKLLDSFLETQYSLKKKYRRKGTWAFNSTTELAVRQVKNDNGDYMWQPPVQAGAPTTFLGRPIVNPEDMPDRATGALFAAFGDFKRAYRVRDRSGVSIKRLEERYAEYDQTAIIVKRRTGGKTVLPEAVATLKGA